MTPAREATAMFATEVKIGLALHHFNQLAFKRDNVRQNERSLFQKKMHKSRKENPEKHKNCSKEVIIKRYMQVTKQAVDCSFFLSREEIMPSKVQAQQRDQLSKLHIKYCSLSTSFKNTLFCLRYLPQNSSSNCNDWIPNRKQPQWLLRVQFFFSLENPV